MQITTKLLNELNAPSIFIQYIDRYYSEGGDPIDIANSLLNKNSNITGYNFIYWILDHVILDDGTAAELIQLLNCIDSKNYYKSHDIKDCVNVVDSYNIINSKHIFYSNEVNNSRMVVNSSFIDKGHEIYSSNFINDSNRVINSNNCNGSSNIVNSTFCINSSSLMNCENCTDTIALYRSTNCTDAYFSSLCNHLTRSIFCYGISGDLLCFNEPITEIQLKIIKEQYLKLFNPLQYSTNWPSVDNLIGDIPSYTNNFKKYYTKQTDAFWKWIKTLPNYNNEILYKITCIEEFL